MLKVKYSTLVLGFSSVLCFTSGQAWAKDFTKASLAEMKASYTSYLKPNEVANSLTLLPPPPQPDSAAFKADQAAYQNVYKDENTPRWALAASDANLSDDHIGKPFSDVLGVQISKKNTPATYHLLRQLMVDSGFLGTEVAKDHYKRVRPFMYYHVHTCRPQDEKFLEKDGSYPSGHSAIGWSTALILSEMFPQKQTEILKRGYDFGESRVVCRAHWQSDVDAGRIIGSGVVARLHADQQFQQDLLKAKEELAQKMK